MIKKYAIKQKFVIEPKIELPESSQIVSVKHHDAYLLEDAFGASFPECWEVVWLEPIIKQ